MNWFKSRESRLNINGRESRLNIVFHQGIDGHIVAECPQIPGCMSQGRDKEEALSNITDAIAGCLQVWFEDQLAHGVTPQVLGQDEQEIRVTPRFELATA